MNTKTNEEKTLLLRSIGDETRPLAVQLRDSLALARIKNLGRPTRTLLRKQLQRIESQSEAAEDSDELFKKIAEIKVVLSRNRRQKRERLAERREKQAASEARKAAAVEATEPTNSRTAASQEPKEPDGWKGFGFLDPATAMFRVEKAGYTTFAALNDFSILQAALGDIRLNAESVKQLYLSNAYFWKEWNSRYPMRAFRHGSEFFKQSRWILCAIAAYVNAHSIELPTPNCFNRNDDILFRS